MSTFRYHRADVAAIYPEAPPQAGVQCLYRIDTDLLQPESALKLIWPGGEEQLLTDLNFPAEADAKHWLLDAQSVLKRDMLYAPGPPSQAATPEVVKLLQGIRGPLFDFGCGIGLYLQALAQQGVEAHGIELDRPEIREQLVTDVAERITLYDGSLPLPYGDGQFESCLCSEVLEHIDDFEPVLAELARVTRSKLILTVPDVTALSLLAGQQVVPYHMLEPTHYNFFSADSLLEVLNNYFKGSTQVMKIGPNITNGICWFSSLAVIAEKY